MKRRRFLSSVGGVTLGGSALITSGAFSRVESHRSVTVEVAKDPNAYLGLKPLDTPNSNNFVDLDENGHLSIDIGDFGAGEDYKYETGTGINSNSNTLFEGMFEICNQGKAAALLILEIDPWEVKKEGSIEFIDEDGKPLLGAKKHLEVGACERIAIDLGTFGVDATDEVPLYDDEVVITAKSEEAGETT